MKIENISEKPLQKLDIWGDEEKSDHVVALFHGGYWQVIFPIISLKSVNFMRQIKI